MTRSLLALLAFVAVALVPAAPAGAADLRSGSVRAKFRTCVPKGAKVTRRKNGVIFSRRYVDYACLASTRRAIDLYGPVYRARLGSPDNDGCPDSTSVSIKKVGGGKVDYLLRCDYTLEPYCDVTVVFAATANLKTGVITYRQDSSDTDCGDEDE